RDGGPNLWIEGEAADRIEYDTKSEVAKFYVNAKIRLLEGASPTDEVEGEFISYDSKQEFYSVNNTPSSASKAGAGRIKAIIQPRNDTKAP
ncbi:MAG: lipopolysaccharide transport periplasmic protein LptA, partial [Burkholderiaceae bacterium]